MYAGREIGPIRNVDDELRATDELVGDRVKDLEVLTHPLLRTALGSETVRWRVP